MLAALAVRVRRLRCQEGEQARFLVQGADQQ